MTSTAAVAAVASVRMPAELCLLSNQRGGAGLRGAETPGARSHPSRCHAVEVKLLRTLIEESLISFRAFLTAGTI